jgi:type I restriction enzyme, S subunit
MEVEEGYKDTKIGRIPKDWEVYKFGDVFEFIKTSSHSKAQMTLDETESDIFNVHYGAIHTTYREQLLNFDKYNVPRITDDSKLPTTNQYLKEGDVVIVDASEDAGGMGECVEINNIGQRKVIGGLHTFAVRDKNGLFAKGFAGYIFKNSISRNKLIGVSNISKVYGVSKGNIVSVPLIIPTLPEQQKIAEILSTVDEQISTTQTIIEKSKELKKGLMQKLFSGGIGHTEFKDTKIGRIPKDWEVVKLDEIIDFTNGKGHEKFIDENGEYIVVNSKFISQNGNIRKYSNELFSPLEKNDITMVMSDIPNGRALAKCFLIDKDNKYTLNQRICGLRVKDLNESFPKFYYYVINRNRGYLKHNDGVGQTNLRRSEVLECLLQFPPLPEQQKIAEILSEVDAKLEKEEQEKAKLEELKKGLMQQLLTGKKRVKV